MELACSVAGALCFVAGAPMLAPLAWLAITLAFFDARYLWLPNQLVAAFAVCAAFAPAWLDCTTATTRIAGGAIGFVSLYLLARVYRSVRKREGLGGGDAKLFGALGLWVGAPSLPTVMLGACAIGLAHALFRLRIGEDARTVRLPLGTYLMITTLIMIGLKLIAGSSVVPEWMQGLPA